MKLVKLLCWVGWHNWMPTPINIYRCTDCGKGRWYDRDGVVIESYPKDEMDNMVIQHITLKSKHREAEAYERGRHTTGGDGSDRAGQGQFRADVPDFSDVTRAGQAKDDALA